MSDKYASLKLLVQTALDQAVENYGGARDDKDRALLAEVTDLLDNARDLLRGA